MAMLQKNRQPQWNIYEAAILLDAYLFTVQKKEPKTHTIKKTSNDLRTMAINLGISIDSVYRNENGISYQIQSMESAFLGRKVYVPATKLFLEIVRLYRDDHEKYIEILGEAKKMIDIKSDNKEISLTYADRGQQDITQNDVATDDNSSEIVKVLKKYYQYGFKYESIRELMRFRQFAQEMNVIIPEDNEQLKTAIVSSGTLIDDKVYFKNNDMLEKLCCLINDILSTGAKVIYYECILQRETEWMDSYVITSEEILKEYLQKYISGCSFSKKFMVKGEKLTEKEAVTSEIKRVWGDKQTESIEKLSYKLPFIPISNIWRVISGNDSFVLSSEGVYLLLDKFYMTEDEEKKILDYVSYTCAKNGYASLSDVPLGDIEERNYKLSHIAIYNAIYKKMLSSKYQLNGKILTVDKPELNAVTLLKRYISGKEVCFFSEVADKVIELTGRSNRQYAFQALYDEMVRIDINKFVADRCVCFDVEEIDSVLEGFVTDHFLAVQDITTFAMFPISGQNWNHYLLESYCYKFSRKYSLHVLNFNNKNAGIIAEKDFNMRYDEMVAAALAREDIELTPEVAGQYLFNTGYMAKSKYARLNEIVQRAKEIRKGS